jgi:hypothetical protein
VGIHPAFIQRSGESSKTKDLEGSDCVRSSGDGCNWTPTFIGLSVERMTTSRDEKAKERTIVIQLDE